MSNQMKLEDKLKRLEQIASKMQDPHLNIDHALELYKEGIMLAKQCKQEIVDVEQQITRITKDEIEKVSTKEGK